MINDQTGSTSSSGNDLDDEVSVDLEPYDSPPPPRSPPADSISRLQVLQVSIDRLLKHAAVDAGRVVSAADTELMDSARQRDVFRLYVRDLELASRRVAELAAGELSRRSQWTIARQQAAQGRIQADAAYAELCERRRHQLIHPASRGGGGSWAVQQELQRLEACEEVQRQAKFQFVRLKVALQQEKAAARRRDDLCTRVERYRQQETRLNCRVNKQAKEIFRLRAQLTALHEDAATVRSALTGTGDQLGGLRVRRQRARDDRVATQSRVQQCKAWLRRSRETAHLLRAEAGLLLAPALLRDFDRQLGEERRLTDLIERLSVTKGKVQRGERCDTLVSRSKSINATVTSFADNKRTA